MQSVLTQWEGGSGALLAMDMGCGKTATILRAIHNHSTLTTRRILVVAPKSVVPVWAPQVEMWWPGTPPPVLTLAEGTTKARAEALDRADGLANIYGMIAVINYDAVLFPAMRQALESIAWDYIVCDEAHRLKAPGGKQSKFLALLRKKTKAKAAALTGTPMPTSFLDIYGIARFCEPSLFGSTYAAFRQRYTRPATWEEVNNLSASKMIIWKQGDQLIRTVPRDMDQFETALASFAYRVDAKDVLDLPPATDQERLVTLEPKARKAYLDIERQLIAEVREGLLVAANAMVKSLRLAQITGGEIPTDGGVAVPISNVKQKAFRELLDDLDPHEPVVVFCRFHSELNRIHEEAGNTSRPSFELSGRHHGQEDWKAHTGEGAVLAVQVQAGGVGIDLTQASVAVWWSLPWSLAQYDQARARLVRPGQTRPVAFVHLVAANTIDEDIAAALAGRREVIDAIMERLKP